MAGEPTDLELISQAQLGNDDAFARLVRRYQRPLYNYLLRGVRNGSLAEEFFQEAFLRCYRGLREFRPQAGEASFRCWLYRIATHLIRDERRRPQFQAALQLEIELGLDGEADGALSPEDKAAWAQQCARVRRAVTALGDLQREAVVLRLYQGLTYEEAADVLGVPVGTVKSRMHVALTQLRKVMVHDGDELAREVAS